jgi:hypothetical protein
MKPYSLQILRYQFDIVTEEFSNIGVALWSNPFRFLGFKMTNNVSRLVDFWSHKVNVDDYWIFTDAIRNGFAGLSKRVADEELVLLSDKVSDVTKLVLPPDDGSLIWSNPRGGVTDDPKQALENAFERYVGRYA